MALQPKDLEITCNWEGLEAYIDSALRSAARIAATDGKEINCCLYLNALKQFDFLWSRNQTKLMTRYHGWNIEYIYPDGGDYHDGPCIQFTPPKEAD